jgi:tetratricopeptide (TPR) repeat protein
MLLPSAVRNPQAWAEIASGLFLRGEVEPWMVRARFVLRDDPREPVLVPFVDQHRLAGAAIYEVDLRTKAMIDALAEEARDPSVPRPERMMAILQLACLDFSYGRLDEALAKYGALHNYFVESQNPAAQAYCLQGAGDTLRRLGRLPEAKARYQQAMVVATNAKMPAISLNAAIGLGETCAARQEIAEAGQWYTLADQIASQLLNSVVRCDLAEKLGELQLAARDYGGAATTWLRGAELSREQRYFTRWAALLERLAALYREARMHDHARQAETTLNQVRTMLSRGHASCDCGVFV